MGKKLLIILTLSALLILSACGPKGNLRCQDGSWVDDANQCPEVQAAMKQLQDVQNMADDQLDQINQDLNDETSNVGSDSSSSSTSSSSGTIVVDPVAKKILELHNEKSIKGFSFLYASLPENLGTHDYYYYGNKVLVMPNLQFKYDATTNSDHIYLDLSTNTARGFCMSDLSGICSEQGAERSVKFTDWVIKSPLDWFDQEGLEKAKKIGSKNFENFEVDILRFEHEGKYYEYLITTFWGFPVRVGIYSDSDYTNLIGGAEYRNIAINGFKESKVEVPQ